MERGRSGGQHGIGDLRALLYEVKTNSNDMEFCEDFNQVQIIMNNFNQYVHQFNKIVFDSGNEPYIIEVVTRLLKYLRTKNYLNEQDKVNREYEPQLRRIMLYLMLNTDVNMQSELQQDARVSHLLNNMPQLTKCLMINCIWSLDMDRFFYEMLRYAPIQFSIHFVEQAMMNLKYGKLLEVYQRIESIVCAIYFSMCRADVEFQMKEWSGQANYQRKLDYLGDFVGQMMKYYTSTEERRDPLLHGHAVMHLFAMATACLNLYLRKPAIPVDPAMAVYQLLDHVHVHKLADVEYSEVTEPFLFKINTFVLNKLESCLMQISLNCYCYWSEVDLPAEGQDTVTMQEAITESAYRLLEELNSFKHFRHTIRHILSHIAVRPKTLAEKAKELNLGMLMSRIDSVATPPDERMVYLNEFINRGEQVFDNAECLETIDVHWELLTMNHLRQMIEFDKGTAAAGTEDSEPPDADEEQSQERKSLREVILRAVSALPKAEFCQLLDYAITTHGTQFAWYGELKVVPSVIELVNLIANADRRSVCDETFRKVQRLIFLSPGLFFNTLLKSLYPLDSNSNQQQLVDAIADIVTQYGTVAKCYLRDHIDQLLVTRFDVCQSAALQRFVQRLYETNLFAPHEFMEQALLDGLRNAFEQMHVQALSVLLELMRRVWPVCCPNPPKAPQKQQDLVREAVKQLVLISDRLRFQYPPSDERIGQSEEGHSARMLLVWLAVEQMLPMLDQLALELPEKDMKDFLQELLQNADNFTSHYITDRLQNYTKMPIPFLTTDYIQSLASPPFGPELEQAAVTFLVELFTQCTREEITRLARNDTFRAHVIKVNSSEMAKRLAKHESSDWAQHCVTSYVACLVSVVLPAEMKRSSDTMACSSAVGRVAELVAGFSPDCAGLHTEVAALYAYVKSVAPTVDITSLVSFIRD